MKPDQEPSSEGRLDGCASNESAPGAAPFEAPDLAQMIEASSIQLLMEDFHKLARIPMSIIDLKGKVLAGVGWQEVCVRFHRVHPETCKHCLESDTTLSAGLSPGEHRLYKCKNNMWDVATPISVDERHVGYVFSGQFFFDDEDVDYGLFRDQAKRYGFDEKEYLSAMEAVPRLSRESVQTGVAFMTKLAQLLSRLSNTNVRLTRSLAERDSLTETLRENQRDLNRAQAVARTGSWRMDVRRNRLLWSDETYRMFGLDRTTPLTYEAFLGCVHPEDQELVNVHWTAALAGQPYDLEHRIVVGKQIKWVRECAELEFDQEGRLRGGFGTVQDITERKELELALRQKEALLLHQATLLEQTVEVRTAQLKELVSDLEHFSYSITHDMRAPLRAMQGFSAVLLEECRSCPFADRLDLLRRIAGSSERMDQLIKDALDYGRVLRNEFPLSEIDPVSLLRGIVESYPIFQMPKAEIFIDPAIPYVIGNKAGLTQCFSNLLANAIKFVAPETVPNVRVHAEIRDGFVRIWVNDNGIGIPQDWHDRIFQMFQRISPESEGTGIGLALVRKAAQRMGGRVGLQSEPNKGSQFWVELPRSG